MNLLLISNSTNAGEAYLKYPIAEIAKTLEGVSEVVFIPYAAVTYSYDEYEAKVQARFNEIGIKVRSIHHALNKRNFLRHAEAIVIGGGTAGMTAAIYLPTAILALFFPTANVTAFWTVTQTISLLLAPALAYCQVRRAIFRIRNRQMDTFSWICTALFVFYLLTNPLDAVRVLALFGAYRLLVLLWHKKRQ